MCAIPSTPDRPFVHPHLAHGGGQACAVLVGGHAQGARVQLLHHQRPQLSLVMGGGCQGQAVALAGVHRAHSIGHLSSRGWGRGWRVGAAGGTVGYLYDWCGCGRAASYRASTTTTHSAKSANAPRRSRRDGSRGRRSFLGCRGAREQRRCVSGGGQREGVSERRAGVQQSSWRRGFQAPSRHAPRSGGLRMDGRRGQMAGVAPTNTPSQRSRVPTNTLPASSPPPAASQRRPLKFIRAGSRRLAAHLGVWVGGGGVNNWGWGGGRTEIIAAGEGLGRLSGCSLRILQMRFWDPRAPPRACML